MGGKTVKSRLRWLAALCATTVAGSSLLLGGQVAHAADTDITITPVGAVFSDGREELPGKQLVKGGRALLTFNWSAENQPGFATGDKFKIGLGDYFTNMEYGPQKTLDMTIATGDNPTQKIGACSFLAKEVTCVFDENVDRLKPSFQQWRGSLKLLVTVNQTTANAAVPVQINDAPQDITLPVGPNQAVGIINPPIIPASVYKALHLTEGVTANPYTIYMSGVRLQGHLQGTDFEFNNPNTVVTFRDSLVNAQGEVDLAQEFETVPHPTDPNKLVPAKPTEWILRAVELVEGAKNYRVDNATEGPNGEPNSQQLAAAGIGEFELTVEFEKANPHVAIVKIKGPFKENFTYSVGYNTKVLNPSGVREGTVYSNRLELLGSTHTFQLDKSYRASAEATAEAVPGYGYFRIEKRIAGAAEGLVTKDHTVNVKYRYELPLPAATYGDWTAPGTMTDATTGEGTCTINFRKANLCLSSAAGQAPGKLLPKGTKVYITAASEDLQSISEPVRDLNWGEPIVELPNKAQFLTITDTGTMPLVTITNKAQYKLGKFAVKKEVTGLSAGANAGPFAFDYSCVKGQSAAVTGRIENVAAGAAATVSEASFPLGSVCTITEVAPAEVPGHTLTQPEAQTLTVNSETTPAEVTFTNAYTKTTATFNITTTATGLEPGVDAGTFNYTYSCVKDGGAPLVGNVVDVRADGVAVPAGQEFPVGAVCTVTEAAPAADAVPGYTLTVPEPVQVTIAAADQPAVAATFVNVYTRDTASLQVQSTASGLAEGVAAPKYAYDYSCKVPGATAPVTGEIVDVPADGTAVAAQQKFPVGTVCDVTERVAAAQVTGYNLAPVAAASVTLDTKDKAFTAAFENVYSQQLGALQVQNTVEGLAADVAHPSYDFAYTCTLRDGKQLTGKFENVATGATSEQVAVPLGAECEITAVSAADVAGYTLAAPAVQQVTVATEGVAAVAQFVYKYTAEPQVEPIAPQTGGGDTAGAPQPGPAAAGDAAKSQLAKTGAETGTLAVAALALLAAGGAALLRKRRA